MHILKIIHGYPPSYNAGSEVYSQNICDEFKLKGHQITILTREEDPYRPDFEIRHEQSREHTDFYFINMPRGKDGYKHDEIDEQFIHLLTHIKPEIAHIGHLNHLSTGLVKELKKLRIPIIFTLHDFWLMCPRGQFLQRNYDGIHTYELCEGQEDKKCATSCYRMYFSGQQDFYDEDVNYWTKWVGRRMEEMKMVISMIDLFIAPSKYLMQRFINDFHLPKEKIIYLDYGFPTTYLKPTERKNTDNCFTFGYIGTHIPAKGVNFLIEAFKAVKGNACLKIWGRKDSQSQKSLQTLIEDSSNPIEFCGEYVNERLAEDVFSEVDIIVVPSIWGENSPLVIHEAQACHIPVITANYGGMAEYVQHQINGLLFNHRDINSLSEQLQWAISYPDVVKNFGIKGYLYSDDGNVQNIGTHCDKLEQIYDTIISENE